MITFLTHQSITPEIETDAQRLFLQLSKRKQIPLSQLLSQTPQPLVVAYMEQGKLLGMASMAMYRAISGHKGWIEDVVVDANERGKQIGTQLIDALIAKGEELSLDEILLFVSPTNAPAVKLYANKGFQDKGVNVMVKALKDMYPNGR